MGDDNSLGSWDEHLTVAMAGGTKERPGTLRAERLVQALYDPVLQNPARLEEV